MLDIEYHEEEDVRLKLDSVTKSTKRMQLNGMVFLLLQSCYLCVHRIEEKMSDHYVLGKMHKQGNKCTHRNCSIHLQ